MATSKYDALPLYGALFEEAEAEGKEAIGELIVRLLADAASCDELAHGIDQVVKYIGELLVDETSPVQREYLKRERAAQCEIRRGVERRKHEIRREKGVIGAHFVEHYQVISDF